MLGVAIAGAALCLVLQRARQVLSVIVAVSAAEMLLAVNIWAAMLAGPGFVTIAEQWLYVDAFSAFHIAVLVLVFLLSSAFAGVYFTSEAEHDFTLPVGRRFGALWLRSLPGAVPGLKQLGDDVGGSGGDDPARRFPDLAFPEPPVAGGDEQGRRLHSDPHD